MFLVETLCQLASADMQHLIDINGVADLLGMTRQGAYKLVERDASFPQPEVEVTAGKIWRTADVEDWMLIPGNRRNANLVVGTDDQGKDVFARFRLVQAPARDDLGRIEVVIPTDALDRHPALRWAKKAGRLEEADGLNPLRRYVPLEDWNQRLTPAGQLHG